jgi:hypothetical protein
MNDSKMNSADQLNVAVLFLVFNRPDTTAQVFEAIRKARPKRLYVAADGPRPDRDGELEKCSRVREISTAVDWPCELHTLFRDANQGCRMAVSSAITWFFENEEQGIILEDDCLPSQSFFPFCEEMLDRYKSDLRVWHIGGVYPFAAGTQYSDSYYFSEYNPIWGWATWRRAWNKFDAAIPFWPQISSTNTIEALLGSRQAKKYRARFWRAYNGDVDTWDYQWFLTRLLHGKSVVPLVNLVRNIGFGDDATHTFNQQSPMAQLEAAEMNFPIKHPEFFIVNKQLDEGWETVNPLQAPSGEQPAGKVFTAKARKLLRKLLK